MTSSFRILSSSFQKLLMFWVFVFFFLIKDLLRKEIQADKQTFSFFLFFFLGNLEGEPKCCLKSNVLVFFYKCLGTVSSVLGYQTGRATAMCSSVRKELKMIRATCLVRESHEHGKTWKEIRPIEARP